MSTKMVGWANKFSRIKERNTPMYKKAWPCTCTETYDLLNFVRISSNHPLYINNVHYDYDLLFFIFIY